MSDGGDQNPGAGPGGLPTVASGEAAGGGGGATPVTPFAPVETPDQAEEDHDNPLEGGMAQGEALGPFPDDEMNNNSHPEPHGGGVVDVVPGDALPAVAAGEGASDEPVEVTPFLEEGVTPIPDGTQPAAPQPRITGAQRRVTTHGPALRVPVTNARAEQVVLSMTEKDLQDLVSRSVLSALKSQNEATTEHDLQQESEVPSLYVLTSEGGQNVEAPAVEVPPTGGVTPPTPFGSSSGKTARKKLSEMDLQDCVRAYKRVVSSGGAVTLDTYSDYDLFYGGFQAWWSCGIGTGKGHHRNANERGRALLDYVQDFIEYMGLLNCPWEKLEDADLEQVFSRGLRGHARRQWRDVTRQVPRRGSERTFEMNFNDFCAGYLLEIQDEGWLATKNLLSARQYPSGESVLQYWARLLMLHTKAVRENATFEAWDESKMMAHWESTLELKLGNLLPSLKEATVNVPTDPEAYRKWVKLQESKHDDYETRIRPSTDASSSDLSSGDAWWF